ncbi:MAG: hypothetical protein NC823_00025, partial [Candidatus Omnitrophica bacterium]|nr:hypothetical protein [Candidatus Omnitrophota bacterium]
MTPREIVLEQIYHHQTEKVPYTVAFEGDVLKRVNAYYENETWQERLTKYVVICGGVSQPPREEIDQHHFRDAFGT